MKKILVFCVVALAALPSHAQSAPLEKGVYVQNGGSWDRLYLANAIGIKSSGIAKSAFSYGIAKAHVEMSYRDAEAPVKTSGSRPVFRILGVTSVAPRDIVIVRLQVKKDHRELQTAKVGAWTGVNMQYPREATTEVSVQQVDNGLLLTPTSDLKPGEYLLFAGQPAGVSLPSGYGGFDFSIK
jgi:hypothetical protein